MLSTKVAFSSGDAVARRIIRSPPQGRLTLNYPSGRCELPSSARSVAMATASTWGADSSSDGTCRPPRPLARPPDRQTACAFWTRATWSYFSWWCSW